MPYKELLGNHNPAIVAYIESRKQLCQNIDTLIASDEYQKASDLVWTTIIHSIGAYASVVKIPVNIHNISRKYIQQILEEIHDNEYSQLFLYLEKLHHTCSTDNMDTFTFPIFFEEANMFLEKTDYLIGKNNRLR